MRFEEVLPLMRAGAKARMQSNTDGEYWICGSQGILDSPKHPIIIRMDKNDCAPLTTWDWGIARWMIMAEDWEIV